MQFLIRHITDSTGHPFVEVIKPRENERYEIVRAESKAEAKRLYRAIQMRNALNSFSKGASKLGKATHRRDSE